jgi:hypothetical protein
MRKLACILAAAVCVTAGASLTTGSASAQAVGVTIGVGNNGHSSGNDRWRSRNDWRYSHRARAQSGIVISTGPSHCRYVTTRTYRSNGTVLIRKVRRCG